MLKNALKNNKNMTLPLNPTESYFDPALGSQTTNALTLSMQVSLNELSFCITDSTQNRHLAFSNYTFGEVVTPFTIYEFIDKLFTYETLLKKNFSHIILCYENNKSTLIPTEIFQEANKNDYLTFNGKVNPDEIVLLDMIRDIESYNVYAIPSIIEKTLKKKFLVCNFIHQSSAFIMSLMNNFNKNGHYDEKVYVNVSTNSFELAAFNDGRFKLYNTFPFKQKEDFIYYILFAMKQLSMDVNTVELVLSGKINPNSPLHQITQKYIANVSFIKRSLLFNYSGSLSEIPAQQYYSLFNLIRCV